LHFESQSLNNFPRKKKKLKKLEEDLLNHRPINVAIRNPDHKNDIKYIPRSKRPEWIPIGLIGKMYVRGNGKCKPGKKCDCENWIVLKRINNNVIQILMK
jgi:hypothetical protein